MLSLVGSMPLGFAEWQLLSWSYMFISVVAVSNCSFYPIEIFNRLPKPISINL